MKAPTEMRVLLLCREKRCNVIKPKIVYCPKCKRKVATWDGKTTINIIAKCQKCNKLVVYDIENRETKVKDIPARNTSSGKTFY